ncbi:alpha/beta fold hydrolase [Ruegeria sediminis]|uniref:Alpha/beta fold hydrolase n=1 Tax=Ruegeria sediminis TaxID=2583820 RepID=A0ABY2X0T8_9RHOB|nr:alpha/beta fold hydrolase [Ruegeria sediminis]TMV08860.1 alpha/beta fold hydrolase [Ruegeria sediminis]
MQRRLTTVLIADTAGYTRLVEADEVGVLGRQRAHLRELVYPTIERNRGRVIKSTGDGMMVEYQSVREAVRCAIDVQMKMLRREGNQPDENRIQYRVGVNMGDMVEEEGDLYGEDVNVAARLEQLAEPGGVCISDPVHQLVQNHIPETFTDLGSQMVKNLSRPIRVWQWTPRSRDRFAGAEEISRMQKVEFCTAPDGVQLAYASVGEGPAMFKMPNWLNHLEYDWSSPIWGPLLHDLASQYRLVRFDQRGTGLSDWSVEDISNEAMLHDVEAVVDSAGLDRFAILAASQGCAIAIRYAVAHPERVRCIVMCGGFVRGMLKRNLPEQEELHSATTQIIRAGWGSVVPAFRHMFTEIFLPDGSPTQKSSFDELQRVASSAENAARINEMNGRCDVSDLAPQVSVPVLVAHAEGDKRVPLEEGRRMAALIPGAEFVTLPGNNHMLLPGTPAYDQFRRLLSDFVAAHAD